jgi:hypothetical protein
MSVLTVKNLFRLAGRQATGLIASLFELMQVELPVPSVPDKKLEKVMKVGFYQNYDTHQKPYASI